MSQTAPAPTSAAGSPRARLTSIDTLRGLVIVIMVLDHVRDFLHVDAFNFDPLDPAHTTVLLFATRWITHFCAPTFVLLAGTSAWLQRERGKTPAELARFLVTRGLWLVVLELTVISFAWSFSLPYLFMLQVIWVIGWSMVALAALVRLPRRVVLVLAVLIIAGHNLLDPLAPEQFGVFAGLWKALLIPGVRSYHGVPIAFELYALLPWLGIMLLGYALGPWFLRPPAVRDRCFLMLGAGMLGTLLVLRYFNIYGDPNHWVAQATPGQSVMDFLRVQKYPPSLLYVCATLGPVFLLMPLISRWRGRAAGFFLVFGSVPLCAYVLHLYLAHALGVVLRLADGQSTAGMFDWIRTVVLNPQVLQNSGFTLPVVYAAWIGVVLALYPLCRWYAGVRARRRDWWLSYL